MAPYSPQTLNAYSYALNNPVTLHDKSGLFCSGTIALTPNCYPSGPSSSGALPSHFMPGWMSGGRIVVAAVGGSAAVFTGWTIAHYTNALDEASRKAELENTPNGIPLDVERQITIEILTHPPLPGIRFDNPVPDFLPPFPIPSLWNDPGPVRNDGQVLRVDLPQELQEGRNAEFGHSPYLGVVDGSPVYAGESKDIDRRRREHGSRFDILDPLGTLTRGGSRAVEQALIARNPGFQNKRNEISPRHKYYQQAVEWGEAWLRDQGR